MFNVLFLTHFDIHITPYTLHITHYFLRIYTIWANCRYKKQTITGRAPIIVCKYSPYALPYLIILPFSTTRSMIGVWCAYGMKASDGNGFVI